MASATHRELHAYKAELLALYRAAGLLLIGGDAEGARALIAAYFAAEGKACIPS